VKGRVGLVLSGGGAKGAYQVGVIKCLADHGVQISAVAGASVGALNGALVASAPDLSTASTRLDMIWRQLALAPPTELRIARLLPGIILGMYLSLLLASGQHSTLELLVEGVSRLIHGKWPLEKTRKENTTLAAILDLLETQPKITWDSSLMGLIDCFLDEDALARGMPLYISAFRSQGILRDLAWAAAGASGFAETPDSEFLHVQALPREEFRQAILASAALPLVFEAQTVGGHSYIDGGIGGWLRAQGKTPITPLLRDAGCRYVIVTHLVDGSLWDRNAFPEVVSLEIRPGIPITRKGSFADTFGFDSSAIAAWMEQGYKDTERCLLAARNVFAVVSAGREAQLRLEEAMSRLYASDSS
jgi:NTE family protein